MAQTQQVQTAPAEHDESTIASMIESILIDLSKVKDKRRAAKEMLEDTFKNDAEYSQMEKSLSDDKNEIKVRKNQLSESKNVKSQLSKMDELADEVKDLNEKLSAYLELYYSKTKKNHIVIRNQQVAIKVKCSLKNPGQLALF